MAEKGFRDKLLRKLNAVEGERLEAEAERAKIKPHAESSLWSDFRRVLAWQLLHVRSHLVFGAWILALVFAGMPGGGVSGVLVLLWLLTSCLMLIYGTGRFLYLIGNAAYFFLTRKKPT